MFIKLFITILISVSIANAQTIPSDSNVEQVRILADANLQILENQKDNPNLDRDSFIFMLTVPSAMAATLDLVVMAGAAGYISLRMQMELEDKFSSIDVSLQPLDEIITQLRSIYNTTDSSIHATQRNIEKLKAKGYSGSQIQLIGQEIAIKNQKCLNRENNNSPDNFCPDFIENFRSEGFLIKKQQGAWIVTQAGKFLCCLEWDSLHCGFEIFDKRGRHKGEVGCLIDEFNPCENNPNRGLHAAPQKDHTPRSQACKR